jgi:nicotine blue oxidoreductase
MIAALILAAGAGRRIGGPKALLRVAGTTFLARAAALYQRPRIELRIAVLGHQAERVEATAELLPGVLRIVNPDPDRGMLSSLLLGLDLAEAQGASAVLMHPVDHPLIAAATVEHVLDALCAGAVIAVPSFGERRGHPAGFARAAWPALRAAPASEGARSVLRSHPEWVVHVPGDAGCVSGINTPADYERVLGGS